MFVALIIVLTLWGKFDPKVKAENAKYEKSLEGKSSIKKTIHRSLDNTEVRTIMKKTEKTYHENGNIHVESELNEKGESHGITRIYHENGQLQVELNWTNNIQDDGNVISYHDDGSKARQVTLVNHLMNGPYYEWHRNGQLKAEGVYNDKVPTVLKEWDENGVLIISEWTNSEKEEYLNQSSKVNTKLLYDLREEYFQLDDNENYPEAIKRLTQIIEQIPLLKGQSLIAYVDPSDMLNGILLEEIYFNRSQLYSKLNLIEDAKNDLIKAVNSNPSRKEPIIHHHLGCAMIQCGDFTSCIDHFNIVLEKDPEYYDSYYMRAVAYSSDKSELRDINKAINDLNKYLEHDPDDVAAHNLLKVLQ